jgi:spore coat protein U-like protein
MNKIALAGLGLFGLLLAETEAYAAAPSNPATATFQVQITIVKECTVSTPANINLGTWGAVDPISTGVSGTTTFNVTCSNGIPYTIGFTGLNDLPSAGGTTHVMKGATTANTNTVQYQLTDATASAAYTGALGNTTSGASATVISGTGTGAAQAKTIKATVYNYTTPVTPDTYSDTVTLSVAY